MARKATTPTDPTDVDALADALAQARLQVDDAVTRLSSSGVFAQDAVPARLRALADNNSSCNTACSCGGGGGGGGGSCVVTV